MLIWGSIHQVFCCCASNCPIPTHLSHAYIHKKIEVDSNKPLDIAVKETATNTEHLSSIKILGTKRVEWISFHHPSNPNLADPNFSLHPPLDVGWTAWRPPIRCHDSGSVWLEAGPDQGTQDLDPKVVRNGCNSSTSCAFKRWSLGFSDSFLHHPPHTWFAWRGTCATIPNRPMDVNTIELKNRVLPRFYTDVCMIYKLMQLYIHMYKYIYACLHLHKSDYVRILLQMQKLFDKACFTAGLLHCNMGHPTRLVGYPTWPSFLD